MKNATILKRMLPALSCLLSLPAQAQTPAPFDTTIRNYIYIGKSGLNADANPVVLYTSGGPATSGGGYAATGTTLTFTNSATAQNVNGIGLNQKDGFAYGMEYLFVGPNSVNANLYRVGANAVTEQVGVIQGPTAADAGASIQYSFVNTASGMVDGKGNYWFSAYTFEDLNPPLTPDKVTVFMGLISNIKDLPAGTGNVTATYIKLDITDPVLQAGYANMMSQMVAMVAFGFPASNADGGWQDMDLNPLDQQFYSYVAFPSTPTTGAPYPKPALNSYLVTIDQTVSPWKVELVNTTPNANPNREEDGLYFDPAGNLWTVFTDGQYAQVDPGTGAVGTLSQSSLPLSNGSNMRGDFASNTPVLPLPVSLESFSGMVSGKVNVLNWTMADQRDLAFFEVLRSTDGRSFSKLATLNTTTSTRYSYTDAAPAAQSYYKLRMTSTSGKTTESGVVALQARQSGNEIKIYPTTVSDRLFVSTTEKKVSLYMSDMNGRVVWNAGVVNGGNLVSFDMPSLPAGAYVVSVFNQENGTLLKSERVLHR